jgi:cell division inhibitor SepF
MADNLLKRAKAFIGLDESEEGMQDEVKQMDMNSYIRTNRREQAKNLEDLEYEIILYEPKVYEDSLNISSHLRQGSPVLINLKHLEPNEGMRLIDFVCGTAYAIDGHMTKIGDAIFLFTPKSVAITHADERVAIGQEIGINEGRRDLFFSNR